MPIAQRLKIYTARGTLLGLLLLASFGCQRHRSDAVDQPQQVEPTPLVDPALLTQRGQLRFVTGSSIGQKLAKQQDLPCLLFFTAEWCTFCHQMEATTFADPSIGKLAEQFVCVLVDADREPECCQQYSIRGYPTVQFLAADGRRLHRLIGRQSSTKLAAGMQAALQRLAWLENTKRKRR